jgi:hypothetical protein
VRFPNRRVKAGDSPVRVLYDDGSGIDFQHRRDALHHLRIQGISGVVELQRADGKTVDTRKSLDDLLNKE